MLPCHCASKLRISRTEIMTSFMVLGAFIMVAYLCTGLIEQNSISVPEMVEKRNRFRATSVTLVHSHPKCQRNMSAAGIPGFSNLSQQIKNFLYYCHCRHFPMILDLPDKCGGADDPEDIFLLLVIKTPPINYERREVLRKTWAKERSHKGRRIRRVFISGTTEGFDKERMNKLLELEQQEHNDILQWDFEESFFNLTLKQILFLEWMERNCGHVQFLFNGDDDVLANTDNMVEYLQGLHSNDGGKGKHLFTGHLITNASPFRQSPSKYYIPEQVYEPNFYPPYCGGGGYLLSGYTALVIYHMSHSIPLLPIDDVYMAMCSVKANLVPSSHSGVKTLGFSVTFKDVKNDPCILKELLLVHKFPPAYIYVIWYQLHDPNLNCGHHIGPK